MIIFTSALYPYAMLTITKPFKFKCLYKLLKDNRFTLLDVGCGNHSASLTKYWFPNCVYFGLDNDQYYNNSKQDVELMDGFYNCDLTLDALKGIPDSHFDVIIMSHVIEHLINGDEVMIRLLPKLRAGGLMYIEYPSIKSTRLPSMKGTLNFFDDHTHCRLYTQSELYNLFLKHRCKIVKGGIRRDFALIMLTPFRAVFDFIRYGYVNGSVFWDLTGFANYLIVKK